MDQKRRILKNIASMKKKWLWISGAGLIFLVAAGYFAFIYPGVRQRVELERKKKAEWARLGQELNQESAFFRGNAGVVVKDLDTGWVISFNQNMEFPSASLVKIPIMAVVFKAIEEGKVKPGAIMVLREAQKTGGSGKLRYMADGTAFTVEELVARMVAYSDNTAANMLIELLGIDYVNGSFREFGLKNTNLSRKMMDFRYRDQGIENYTTAQDIACVLDQIYRKQLINYEVSTACLDILKQQRIRDRIPAKLPPETVVANKTGLERGVCHDAGIIFSSHGNFLVCVLTGGAGDSRSAKSFIANLASSVYKCYNDQKN